MNTNISITLAFAMTAISVLAADMKLPQTSTQGGMPLMQALAGRKTSRDFSQKELAPEALSALLWAANGINRPDGHRTAPTGLNVQDIDVYVVLPSGAYIYNAKDNLLVLVNEGDFREFVGKQDFTKTAPLNLFYVQNLSKAMKGDENTNARHGGIHAGAIMQNVYLFCASENLSCVARDYFDRDEMARVLKLGDKQRIIISQTVGYPSDTVLIGIDAAKKIALENAGAAETDVQKLKCELDTENGVQIYEVEFKKGGVEYDYDIDAKTGSIIKSEKE